MKKEEGIILNSSFLIHPAVFKAEKQEVIDCLKERFQGSSSVICVSFRGVSVEKITQFRRQLQHVSGDYAVVKNTLAKRAIAETPFKGLDQFLVGPTGIVFCPGDPVDQAKIVTRFVQETNGALQIKGGIVGSAIFDAKGIQKVATLPPRQELLGQFVGALQTPIAGLVGTLEGIVRECVYTLQAIAEKKSSQG